MRPISSLLTGFALVLTACGGSPATADKPAAATTKPGAAPSVAATPDGWVEADLHTAPNKLPIIVKAPAGYTLGKGTFGVGVELASEKLTFLVDDATNAEGDDVAREKKTMKTDSGLIFEKFVLEQPDGFIVQMKGDYFIPYRLVTVDGRKYAFSVIPLHALPSEKEARQFFDLAALARTK